RSDRWLATACRAWGAADGEAVTEKASRSARSSSTCCWMPGVRDTPVETQHVRPGWRYPSTFRELALARPDRPVPGCAPRQVEVVRPGLCSAPRRGRRPVRWVRTRTGVGAPRVGCRWRQGAPSPVGPPAGTLGETSGAPWETR